MEQHLVYMETGPLKGYRVVKTKQGLKYAASAVDPSSKVVNHVEKLKLSLPLGEADGINIFSGMVVLMKNFFLALAKNETLTHLDLSDCAINDKIMEEYIALMMKENKKIECLKLKRNNLTFKGVETLFIALDSRKNSLIPEGHPGLKELDLGSNMNLFPQTGNALVSSKGRFDMWNLHQLSLKYSENFGADGVGCMINVLNSTTIERKDIALKILDLSGVQLGDDGAQKLSGSFKALRYSSLSTLNLSECGIKEFGVKCICDELINHDQVENLDLSKNGIGDGSLPHVSRLIQNSAKLQKLNLKACEFSVVKFQGFIESLKHAYENFGTSYLHSLNISKNGLGDVVVGDLTELLKLNNCSITSINYDKNEMTDVGAKKWAQYIQGTTLRNREDKDDKTENFLGNSGKNTLTSLTLKDNEITWEGIWKLSTALKENQHFYHLDIRENNVGLVGARYLKKFFFGRSKSLESTEMRSKQFVLEVYPDDVGGPAGINELFIGMRSAGVSLMEKSNRFLLREMLNPGTNTEDFAHQIFAKDNMKIPIGNYLIPYPQFYEKKEHLPFILQGFNETKKQDTLEFLYDDVFIMTYQHEVMLNPSIWSAIRKGYTGHIANAIYRHALILRFLEAYQRRDPNQKLIHGYPSSRRDLWNKVMKQVSPKSEGLTLLEYAVQYGLGPIVDLIRQMSFLYPSRLRRNRTDMRPFTFAKLPSGTSYKTVESICSKSNDPILRRWASTKYLIAERYAVLEYIYKSKTVAIVRGEDLFNTEDTDLNRYFYIRQFPETDSIEERDTSSKKRFMEIAQLRNTEVNTYASIERSLQKASKINGMHPNQYILLRINSTIRFGYFHATIPSFEGKGEHCFSEDVVVWEPYVKTLRQAMDNEALASPERIILVKHIAYCVACGLILLNDRKTWTSRRVLDDNELVDQGGENDNEKESNRIHGNLKPRNIVLREVGTVGKGKKSEIEEIWAIMDFTKSAVHGDMVPVSRFGESAYMPPEVARRAFSFETNYANTIAADEKIDSWAFGAVLYEMLAGVPLFQMEYREDSILRKEDRAELANWVRLDEERRNMILRDFPKDEVSKKIRDDAINLITWCLNGDPNQRPLISEIRLHPFLEFRTKQKKEPIGYWQKLSTASGDKKKLILESHVHIVNAGFEEARTVVHAFEEFLYQVGCKLSTDIVEKNNTIDDIELNSKNARIVVCLLSSDCFLNPMVLKQLIWAHKAYEERCSSTTFNANSDIKSVNFVEIENNVGPRRFKREEFLSGSSWEQSDGFQYLVNELSADKEFVKMFVEVSSIDDEESLSKVLREQYHPVFRSLLRRMLVYRPIEFMGKAMLKQMLNGGKLQDFESIIPYIPSTLKKNNFKVHMDATDQMILQTKQKQKKAFFLFDKNPETRFYQHRIAVLDGDGEKEFMNEAVPKITAALQAFAVIVKEEDEMKYRLDRGLKTVHPFTKVLSTRKVKKISSSHLPPTPRITFYNKLYDALFTEDHDPGKLIVVAIVDSGFHAKFGELLEEYYEKRQDELIIIPVYLSFSKTWQKEYEVLMEKLSPELKKRFQDKSRYIPYYKEKENWEHLACLDRINSVAFTLSKLKSQPLLV